MKTKSDREGYCKERVHNPGTTVTFHQCRFKAVKDGFCRIHHPDAEELRRQKSAMRWKARQKHDPLRQALARIKVLEKENRKLQKQDPRSHRCLRCGAGNEWIE